MEEILVYISSKIDKENKEISFQQINNYKYPFENYYQEIEKIKELKNEEDLEIYCIIGKKEKISELEKETKSIIRKIFDIMLENGIEKSFEYLKDISNKGTNSLERWTSYYIKNTIKEDSIKYPLVARYPLENEIEILCLYNSENSEQSYSQAEDVNATINLFLEKENPYILGKQIMLQSFLLQNIKGRKIISVLPEKNNKGWYALLEGGYKLPIDITNLYELEKISSRDVPMWTVYEIDNILKNSCYAYGKAYMPQEIFEEWNDVFLYALATLKIEYNEKNLNDLIEDFNKFIEKEACEYVQATPIIDKETFLKATILNIENIRGYLRGLEEVGISKNILLQVKNRYAYLPIIYKVIAKRYPEEVKNRYNTKKFEIEEWKELIKDLEKGSNYEKGIHLEEIANYFIECIEGLNVSGRRVKLENQEIDLCCYNLSESGFLWELGTIILVECKNYEKTVETKEIRSMFYLMDAKGVDTFILFARNGITSGAEEEILKQSIYDKKIIVIDEDDLKRLENNGKKPIDLLKEKIEEYNEENY